MEPISFTFGDEAVVPGFIGMDAQRELVRHLLELDADKLLLVCDEHADSQHGDFFGPLRSRGPCASTGETGGGVDDMSFGLADDEKPGVEKLTLPAGEAAKSWDQLSELMRWCFEAQATQRSVVVAFGGGAAMNVAGLFASLVFGGIRLVYVPTTLGSMLDVATSMKTSISMDGCKDNVGSFYAPTLIIIDVLFCRSLPRAELFSGLGELARIALLLGGDPADAFAQTLSKEEVDAQSGGSGEELTIDDASLLRLIRLGIGAKMAVIARDGREEGEAACFEYGNTIAHAIEKAYGDGVVPHGLAVAWGMLACSHVAARLGAMAEDSRQCHDDLCHLLLKRYRLPEPKPTVEAVLALAKRDARRGIADEAEDELSDVLLTRIGHVRTTEHGALSKFPKAWVEEWLGAMEFTRTAA